MIKALIFDLDGVIVDTAHYHFLAWRRLAAELGFDLTPEANEQLKGVSRVESLELILQMGNITLGADEKHALAEKKNGWFVEYLREMKKEEIFPGVSTLLQAAQESGLKIALASSSKNAPLVIELLGIGSFFDIMIDGTMITNGKPDPEIFLLAASKIGIEPGDCVVVEDAEAGVIAAVNAGMKCIGIGKPEQLSKADVVLAKTGDITFSLLAKL